MNEAIENNVTVAEPEETAKAYEFKQLTAEHIFPMINIINKIGIKEFKATFESESIRNTIGALREKNDEETAVKQLGITIILDAAQIVLSNLPKCENEIFAFLGSVSTLSEQKIRKLPLVDFTEMVFDFFRKEELGDFIKVVSKLFK